MHNTRTMAVVLVLAAILFSCKNDNKNDNKNSEQTSTEASAETVVTEEKEPTNDTSSVSDENTGSSVFGNYVTDDYAKRAEGYDWVGVMVSAGQNNSINIKVRSRADKKRPTCTFDAVAYPTDDETYNTFLDGKKVLFRFTDNSLEISTENEADAGLLNFYCSGGASIAGSYDKIDGEIEAGQVDKTQFAKVLNLQGVGFNVNAKENGGTNQLTIFTFGLEEDFNETMDIGNYLVVRAEVEDLNSDGSPEIVVFAQSQDETKKIRVYAYSVNNKKSMSEAYFPPTEDNPEINSGYNGHDEFWLVETYLVQRFPIYDNGEKTDKTKEVQYKMAEGEALRKFEIVSQREFSTQ
ncbi:hypothetical protein ACT6NV_09325 [Robiginitalea sp. IMCC44478]|uniref:hypothetical protein n=1 Tax=Robiginitalea sp. IMCC44478 TaxID=3459122 RepID=UPI0040410E09